MFFAFFQKYFCPSADLDTSENLSELLSYINKGSVNSGNTEPQNANKDQIVKIITMEK